MVAATAVVVEIDGEAMPEPDILQALGKAVRQKLVKRPGSLIASATVSLSSWGRRRLGTPSSSRCCLVWVTMSQNRIHQNRGAVSEQQRLRQGLDGAIAGAKNVGAPQLVQRRIDRGHRPLGVVNAPALHIDLQRNQARKPGMAGQNLVEPGFGPECLFEQRNHRVPPSQQP